MMFPPAYGRELPIIFAAVLGGQARALCCEPGRSGWGEVCGMGCVGIQSHAAMSKVMGFERIEDVHACSSFVR